MRMTAALLLVLLVVAGCAGPHAIEEGPTRQQASRPPHPPADTLPGFSLVKDEPVILAASQALEVAAEKNRPALLLTRAGGAVAAGQSIRGDLGISFTGLTPGYNKYLALYDLAYLDLKEIVVRFPNAPEAPEAQFLLGLIHDYPHLDSFDEAIGQYLLTIEIYPGTEWSQRAAERIRRLEAMRSGGNMPSPGETR